MILKFVAFPIKETLIDISIYFTYWSLLFTLVYFCLAITMRPPSKALSILLPVSIIMETLVTIIYWLLLYKTARIRSSLHQYIAIVYHSCPLGLLVLDLAIGDIKQHRRAIWYFVFVLFFYGTLAAVLALGFNVVVYSAFDFKSWRTAVNVALKLAIAGCTWAFLLLVDKIKWK